MKLKNITWILAGMLCTAYPGSAQSPEVHTIPNLNLPVPDGNGSGLSWTTNVTSQVASVSSVRVKLTVAGEFNGDLYAYLRHLTPDGTNLCILLNRPGRAITNLSGYADAGLDVTLSDAGGGDIHLYSTLTNLPSGTPLNGTWQPDGRKTDPAVVLDSSARGTSLAAFQGMSGSGEWTLFVADVESGGTNLLESWALELDGLATPSVSWPTPADIVYGTPLGPTQLNASSPVPGSFTYDPASGTVLNAGPNQPLSVVFVPTDTAQYLSVTNVVSLNVLPKDLTIAADDKSKIFGDGLPILTATYTGLVNGDTPADLTQAPTLATTAGAGSPVGNYPITASGAGSPNYTISYSPGTLAITPANTTGLLAVTPNPALPGGSIEFSFCLSAVAPGAGIPTGTVQFKLDGANAGVGTLSSGCAILNRSDLTFGLHTVEAEYAGDGNFIGTTNVLATDLIVNTPPVAGPDSITRVATNGTKVSITGLLANDSDADAGDAISLLSVAETSTRGATLTISNGWIFYTPLVGDTNVDSFAYTIEDTLGATALGTVTVNPPPDNVPPMNLTIADQGDGTFLLRFDGIPNAEYSIEYATSLAPPDWQLLVTTNADAFGLFSVTVTNVPPQRFYRSVYR